MGLTLIYQALSDRSSLFIRLQQDERIAFLYAYLFNHGGGPFSWALIRDDLEEVLAGIAEDGNGFASRAEVDRVFEDLLGELDELRSNHPGAERRAAFLEKVHDEIRDSLAGTIEGKARCDGPGLVNRLLYGERRIFPHPDHPLDLVPYTTVELGSQILRSIEPQVLFPRPEQDYLREDYGCWRDMYLAAFAHREVVVVGR